MSDSSLHPDAPSHCLDDSDRKELLRIARVTLKEWLKSGRVPPGAPHRASLLVPSAAFVTVHVAGQLRGCIGHLESTAPLWKTVGQLAVAAATRDPRFAPLRLEELQLTRLTISVLSALSPARAELVEVGRHGLVISRAERRGLLLPQVPVEHGWDRETFLAEACRKAGLEHDAWRAMDVTIETFTAEVFADG